MKAEWERLLQEALARRSAPGRVTDLAARTISDQDREGQLRAHLELDARSEAEAEASLAITDEGLLMEIAAGF